MKLVRDLDIFIDDPEKLETFNEIDEQDKVLEN